MSSDRLRSTLYHSTPKPLSRPPPLWQVANALDTAAVPSVATVRGPATSAVLAGWVCVGIGLLTAWFFPLAHVFFSIAMVLSVVAMATHQVRGGLGLLAGALASMGVCVILFICGVAVIVAGALHAATKSRPEIAAVPPPVSTARLATPAISVSHPVATEETIEGDPNGSANSRPAALTDVLNLLAEGRPDDEILAAAAGRLDPARIGSVGLTSLRAYGASERLIDRLLRSFVPGNGRGPSTSFATPPPIPARIIVTAPRVPANQAYAPPPALATPVDHAARDREITALKKQADQIDETIRRVRADPHYYGLMSGSTNTARQQSSDTYLEQLDKQRNDLRRQKWALEGR